MTSVIGGLLMVVEALVEALDRDDPDVAEFRRFARNGAAMAQALHEAAHDRPAIDYGGPAAYEEWALGAAELASIATAGYPREFARAKTEVAKADAMAKRMVREIRVGADGVAQFEDEGL